MQADQGFHCLLTESMDTVVYVEEQGLLRSGFMDAHTYLIWTSTVCKCIRAFFPCCTSYKIKILCATPLYLELKSTSCVMQKHISSLLVHMVRKLRAILLSESFLHVPNASFITSYPYMTVVFMSCLMSPCIYIISCLSITQGFLSTYC